MMAIVGGVVVVGVARVCDVVRLEVWPRGVRKWAQAQRTGISELVLPEMAKLAGNGASGRLEIFHFGEKKDDLQTPRKGSAA